MNFAPVISALALPPDARVDRRVSKKLLLEHGAPTAADKRHLQDGIEEMLWVAELEPIGPLDDAPLSVWLLVTLSAVASLTKSPRYNASGSLYASLSFAEPWYLASLWEVQFCQPVLVVPGST